LFILAYSRIIGSAMPLAPPSRLPSPPPEAEALSRRLAALIRREIDAGGGWVGFARFMELALYAPGLGYYSAGSLKFGRDGDFVTAPELSPLFGRCVARQIGELVAAGLPDVLELGAGSGMLAADVLQELAATGHPPARYLILEVSADLRERQRATIARRIPALAHLVQWVDVLPRGLRGTVVANEVLDAIPARIVQTGANTIDELGVTCDADGAFAWAARPADPALAAAIRALNLPDG
jgi:SAM-dependent MidA family methyltransferase